MQGLVLFAHGARDPEWARPFEDIARRVQDRSAPGAVSLGYLEFMQPSLGDAIEALVARGATSIAIFPLFMAQGGHLKQDVPKLIDAVRARHPGLPITLRTALGDLPEMREAIASWILSSR